MLYNGVRPTLAYIINNVYEIKEELKNKNHKNGLKLGHRVLSIQPFHGIEIALVIFV